MELERVKLALARALAMQSASLSQLRLGSKPPGLRIPLLQRRARAITHAASLPRVMPTMPVRAAAREMGITDQRRSEEHTSELQSLMRISYAVFCWKKKE